jgi:D-glycero-D-manno-heptose 1,7-bisphosphate phosphatase
MIQQVLRDYNVTADQVIAIGDSVRDLESAQAVGVKAVLVKTGKGKESLQKMAEKPIFKDTPVYDDLSAAVADMLK